MYVYIYIFMQIYYQKGNINVVMYAILSLRATGCTWNNDNSSRVASLLKE